MIFSIRTPPLALPMPLAETIVRSWDTPIVTVAMFPRPS